MIRKFLLCGNKSWIIYYKIGVIISDRMAKGIEKVIPLYLFGLSLSFNQGIESLNIIKEKYTDIYKTKNGASLTTIITP